MRADGIVRENIVVKNAFVEKRREKKITTKVKVLVRYLRVETCYFTSHR